MVEITVIKNGRTMRVSEKQADAFVRAGVALRSAYMTRDMRAVEVPAVVMSEPVAAPVDNAADPPGSIESPADELDSMSDDELRELAESRDIKVHHRAGRAKILAALRGE